MTDAKFKFINKETNYSASVKFCKQKRKKKNLKTRQ